MQHAEHSDKNFSRLDIKLTVDYTGVPDHLHVRAEVWLSDEQPNRRTVVGLPITNQEDVNIRIDYPLMVA